MESRLIFVSRFYNHTPMLQKTLIKRWNRNILEFYIRSDISNKQAQMLQEVQPALFGIEHLVTR